MSSVMFRLGTFVLAMLFLLPRTSLVRSLNVLDPATASTLSPSSDSDSSKNSWIFVNLLLVPLGSSSEDFLFPLNETGIGSWVDPVLS